MEVWLVVDCMSSLDMESVSVSVSSGLVLVEFCDSLVGSLDSLDTVGAAELGHDSGLVSAFGVSLSSGWPLMAMRCANMLSTSSGDYDGLEMVGISCMVVDGLAMVGLLCTLLDGLVRLVLYLFEMLVCSGRLMVLKWV